MLKRKHEEELQVIKERNQSDMQEIERLHKTAEGLSQVGEELSGQARHLEQEA